MGEFVKMPRLSGMSLVNDLTNDLEGEAASSFVQWWPSRVSFDYFQTYKCEYISQVCLYVYISVSYASYLAVTVEYLAVICQSVKQCTKKNLDLMHISNAFLDVTICVGKKANKTKKKRAQLTWFAIRLERETRFLPNIKVGDV